MSDIEVLLRHIKRGPVLSHQVHPHKGTFNERVAVWTTEHVGTMQCAYLFAGIGIGSLVGVLTNNIVLALVCGSVSSYILQLVLLPVIMVGQKVQQRQSDEVSKQNHDLLVAILKAVDPNIKDGLSEVK